MIGRETGGTEAYEDEASALTPAERAVVAQLEGLRDVHAPESVLPGVLRRLGARAGEEPSMQDVYTQLETPLGRVFVAFNERGVSALLPAPDESAFERAFRERFGRSLRGPAEPPAALAKGLWQLVHAGGRAPIAFDLSEVSAFERSVLEKAQEIPRGEVRTYSWVAREIGRPKAVRAVGTALARNPIPILIPCHRVVRTDNRIDGYVFGDDAKRALLEAEGLYPQIEELARTGVRYFGSDTTHIFCFPSCRQARRITDQHRVYFRSEQQAVGAGYRPCQVCHPSSPNGAGGVAPLA